MSRYLSGIQPSSQLHLGNYFGAIKPSIELSHAHTDSLYFIADLHSLTSVTDASLLRKSSHEIAATYLALGISDNAILFRQSDVPVVGNLSFILSCRLGHGALSRAHAFKDKVAKGLESSAGLFYYPVLMAADILLYRSNYVPVGQDQHQHLQIAQDIARSFNALYGDIFPVPQPLFSEFPKIPGLDGAKMSKSYGNHIPLMCPAEQIKAYVSKILTDSRPVAEPKEPDFTLYQILEPFLTNEERTDIIAQLRAGTIGYGALKSKLIESMTSTLKEPRDKFLHYTQSESGILAVRERLSRGAIAANTIATETISKVYRSIGLS